MDVHFNGYKMRYHLLDYYMKPIFNSQKVNSVSIYINLDNVFHNLHRPLTNNEFQVSGLNASKQLISNVFNLIAHYKQWGIRNKLHTKVICTFTSAKGNFKNDIFVPQYRKKFITYNNPLNTNFYYINEAIRNAYSFLRVISNYIQDVYVIDTNYIEPSVAPLYLSKHKFISDWNIMISRDYYDLQYAFRDKWSYISPKSDNSTYISKDNLWDYLKEKERITMETHKYDPSLFTLLLAVSGDKWRNIERIKKCGWKTLFKYLEKIYDMSSEKEISSTSLRLLLFDELKSKTVTAEVINKNILATSIEIQEENLGEIDKTYIDDQIKDMPDYDTLCELNRLHFSLFPLNLAFLINDYEKPKSKNPFGI